MRSFLSFALCSAITVAATSCAVVHRPPTTIAQLEQDAVAATRAEDAARDSVLVRLVRRAVARGDRTLDVLMLSGGGQNGAFGAGFLRGWQARTGGPLPAFDLITGVSTGALQAPFALVGTKAAIDTLGELYREAEKRVAPKVDFWFWLRKTGGVTNMKRYDKALSEMLGGIYRNELRTALRDGRQVVVATTDYDLAIGRTWLFNDVYDTTATALAASASLLKAATSIPGIFPPVILENHVHGDGGVVTNVLPLLSFADYQRLSTMLAAQGVKDVTIRVFVVMNLWSHAKPEITRMASRKKITDRANIMLFYSHQPQTLELLDALSRAVTSGVPGMKVEFKVTTQPAELALQPGADKLFDHAFVQQLDSLGFEKGRSAKPWDALPSAFSRPAPIPK